MDRLQVCLWEEEKKKRNGGTEKDEMIEQLQSETDNLRALLKDERRRRRVKRCIMKEWKAEILRVREPEGQRSQRMGGEPEKNAEDQQTQTTAGAADGGPTTGPLPLTQFGSPQCQGVHPPLKLVHPAGPLLSLAPHLLGHLEVGRH
eukprot:XP_014028093.1 PREDICTED: uncharacterized protein LOC106585892 isoform X3 [Salmo salar]